MYLLDKYGMTMDDYFSKESRERFKARETKSLVKKKIIRTNEGLCIHHMDTILNSYNPCTYQKKEQLVLFCPD